MDQNYSGQGPGLRGIFVGGEPVYSYQGPLGIDEALFTPSALNRLFVDEPSAEGMPPAPQDVLAITDGYNSGGKTPPWARIASGDRYKAQAKNLNDMYGLVKSTIRLRNPDAAEAVAPLILQDKQDVEDAVAYYVPGSHRIYHPVFDQVPTAGYESNVAPYVVVNTPEGTRYYRDRFVPASGTYPDMAYDLATRDALTHEAGHSLDYWRRTEDREGLAGLWDDFVDMIGLSNPQRRGPKSGRDQEMWRHVVSDFYLYPRLFGSKGDEDTNMQEAFAESFSHAMRNDYAANMPELKRMYEEQGKKLPYELQPMDVLPKRRDKTSILPDTSVDPQPYVDSLMQRAREAADKSFAKHSAPEVRTLFGDNDDTVDGKVLSDIVNNAYGATYSYGNQYLDQQVPDNIWRADPTNVKITEDTWRSKMDAIDPTAVERKKNAPKGKASKSRDKNVEMVPKLNTLNEALRVERAKRQAQFLDYFLNQYW